jgi:hypothetical protein
MKKTLLIGALLLLVAAVAVAAVVASPMTTKTSSMSILAKTKLIVRCEKDPSSGATGPCPSKVYLYDNTDEHNHIAHLTTAKVTVGSNTYQQVTFKNVRVGQTYFLVANGIASRIAMIGPGVVGMKTNKVFSGTVTTDPLKALSNTITINLVLITPIIPE